MRYKSIDFFDQNIIFALYEDEYISNLIVKGSNFYELDHLEILHYLPIREDGMFVDIGANIGNHTLYYAKILKRKVYAFEPIQNNYKLLKHNILLNGVYESVKSFNFALGSRDTTVLMSQNYEDNAGTWSIVAPCGDIVVHPLDSVIDKEDVAYIKIDVEGKELDVLKGAKKTIERCKPVVSTEFHFGSEFEKIDAFLSKLGYKKAFIAGRSTNAIFIHSSTIDNTELSVLQNFIEQVRNKQGLEPHILPRNNFKNKVIKRKFIPKNSYSKDLKTKELDSIDKDLLLEKAFLKNSELESKKSDIAEPNDIAQLIINKLSKSTQKIVINFTDKRVDDFTTISIDNDYKISINDELVFEEKISKKVITDTIRFLQASLSEARFLIIIPLEEELLAVAHELFELNQLEYGIVVSKIIPLHWEKWSWLSNARFIYTEDKDIYKEFSTKYIFHIDLVEKISIDKQEFLPFKPQVIINKKAEKKGLLISYYYEPALSVGIFRPAYWFNNIEEISNSKVHLELVTAMRQMPEQKNLHYVPDYGTVTGITTDASIKKEHEQIKSMVNTVAFSWTKSLESYFDAHPELEYDFVILTGNPFMHFYFSEYAKKRWGAKVIQDYRDPMGKNPRFYSKDIEITKRNEQMRQGYEDRFCSEADIVVTVNEYCAKDMSVMSPQPVEIIGNGYNDKVIDSIDTSKLTHIVEKFPQIVFSSKSFNFFSLLGKSKKRSQNNYIKRLCYAGSFAHDRKPENLIQSVRDVLGYELHHFGTPYPILAKSGNKRLVSHAKKPYDEVIASMVCMDIGVVYCSHDFESTTKIYDYIACDMVILVITSEENQRPYNLSRELEGLEYVYWIVNNEEKITEFLVNTVFPEKIKRPQREKFSRREGVKKLINLINKDMK